MNELQSLYEQTDYFIKNVIENNNEKYKVLSEIGQGGFKTAYKIKNIKTNEKFVLLVFNSEKGGWEAERAFKNIKEFSRLFDKKCSKDNLVICPVATGTLFNGKLYFITNFFRGTNLFEFEKNENDKNFKDECDIINIFLAVLNAMKQMHQMKFIHFDIKPENIMMYHAKKKYTAGIIDTDSGCFIENIKECFSNRLVTLGFTSNSLAQEIVDSDNYLDYIFMFDIYSLGKTFQEFLFEGKKTRLNIKFKVSSSFLTKMKRIIKKMTPETLDNRQNKYYKNIDEIIKDMNKFKLLKCKK